MIMNWESGAMGDYYNYRIKLSRIISRRLFIEYINTTPSALNRMGGGRWLYLLWFSCVSGFQLEIASFVSIK